MADCAQLECSALGVLCAVGPVAAKCVDSSGPGNHFATVRYAARDEVFLAGPHWNPLPIDDQGIAALDNDHVFVVIVGVSRGYRRFTAGPKCHLASVSSIEDVALNAGSRLIGSGYPVCRVSHEIGEIVHGFTTLSHFRANEGATALSVVGIQADRTLPVNQLRSGRVKGKLVLIVR